MVVKIDSQYGFLVHTMSGEILEFRKYSVDGQKKATG
jgi:hypothetical protein